MPRISSTNTVSSKRIQNMVVHRNTVVENTKGVEAVSPTGSVENNVFYRNETFLLASDQFYDKLKKLKKEFRRFYHNQLSLRKAMDEIGNNSKLLADNLDTLVNLYNETLLSLNNINLPITEDYSSQIHNILLEYKESLLDIGITINTNNTLLLDKVLFTKKTQKYEANTIELLFEPVKGVIVRLYKILSNIELSISGSPYNNSIYNSGIRYEGIIIDEKY